MIELAQVAEFVEDHVIDAFLRRVNQQRVQREPPAPAEAASARVHTPECEFPTVPQAERRCVLQAHRHPLGPSRVPHREQQFTPRHPHAHVLAGKHAQTVLPPRYRHDSPLTNRRAGSGGGNFATSRNCRTIHAPRRATRAGISNSGKSGGATTRRRHLDAERPAFAAHQHKRNGMVPYWAERRNPSASQLCKSPPVPVPRHRQHLLALKG